MLVRIIDIEDHGTIVLIYVQDIVSERTFPVPFDHRCAQHFIDAWVAAGAPEVIEYDNDSMTVRLLDGEE